MIRYYIQLKSFQYLKKWKQNKTINIVQKIKKLHILYLIELMNTAYIMQSLLFTF